MDIPDEKGQWHYTQRLTIIFKQTEHLHVLYLNKCRDFTSLIHNLKKTINNWMQTTQEAHMSLYPSPCKEDLLKYCLLKYIQVMLFFSFQDINLIQYIYIPALLTSCKNKLISNNFYSSYHVNKKTFSKKKFPPQKNKISPKTICSISSF